jgi:hypothetical protein
MKKAIEFQYASERKQAAPNVPLSQVRQAKVKPLGVLNGMRVWLVDSETIRRIFDIDFTMGSHDAHSAFIPHGEIWVSRLLPPSDLAPLLVHEAVERQWMVHRKWSYERAHDRASVLETQLRRQIHRHHIATRAQAMQIARVMVADFFRRDRA